MNKQEESTHFIKVRVPRLLDNLTETSRAKWGIMGPQHMLEHLSVLFYFSSKERGMKVILPASELGFEDEWLDTNEEFPRFIKGAGLKVGETERLRFGSLEETKGRFLKGLNGFFAFFADNPDSTLTHPVFGDLDFARWLQFHHKHIQHHFKQFGLIEESTQQ